MANGFIKKNWQKDATANLIQSGARIAGGTVTAWGLQKFFGPTKSDGTDNAQHRRPAHVSPWRTR